MKRVLIMDTVLPVSAHNPPPKPSVVLLMNCVPLMVVGPLKNAPPPPPSAWLLSKVTLCSCTPLPFELVTAPPRELCPFAKVMLLSVRVKATVWNRPNSWSLSLAMRASLPLMVNVREMV